MFQLKYILKYLLSLINDPGQTWKFLTEDDVQESKPEYMQNNYYLPMMGVVAVALFLMAGWGTTFDIERAMKTAVKFLASYFAGPFLADFILRKLHPAFFGKALDKDRLLVFIGYSMSFLMLVELFSASFPTVRFIAFCALYLFYIVWCATDVFFNIEEKIRWKFSALSFFVIWGSPIIIGKLIAFMII